VLPRDENRLKESYAALVDRAKAAYEGDLPRIPRINEREVVSYLLECSTDPAAVPYLEELLQSGPKAVRMSAVRGLLRIRNEDATAVLQGFAEGPRAQDWERSQIEKWLQADRLPEPWEEWW
jgi:HEAT repeat protein